MNAIRKDDELLPRVRAIISETTGKDPDTILPESSIDSLVNDSIELFRLMMAFEKEFGRCTDYRELMRIETVEDIVSYIKGI